MDNYKPDVKIVEDRTAFERDEESRFLDLVLETPVMQKAYSFMIEKGQLFNDCKGREADSLKDQVVALQRFLFKDGPFPVSF